MNEPTVLDNLGEIDIKFPSTNIIYGGFKSGKTTLLKELLYHFRDKFDRIIVFTSRDKIIDDRWDKILDEPFIRYDFNEDLLGKLMEINKKANLYGNNRQLCIVIDECLIEKNNKFWLEINRHYGLTLFVTCNNYKRFSHFFMANCHNIFITGNLNDKQKKHVRGFLKYAFLNGRVPNNFIRNYTEKRGVIFFNTLNRKLYNISTNEDIIDYHIDQ